MQSRSHERSAGECRLPENQQRELPLPPIGTADLSDAGVLNEVDYLLRAALRLVLEEEVANAAEQHELGAVLQ